MKRQAALTLFVLILCAIPCTSQRIQIRVLDARHGNPVQNECLKISLIALQRADLFAPTNKSGIAALSFSKDHVSAEPAAENKMCGHTNLTTSFSTSEVPTTLSPLPHNNVSCQSVTPAFNLRDILKDGVVSANTCSRLKPTPVPGELILIVRKITFLEKMRE